MVRIYIETYGCPANQNDSEIMAGLLQKAGYTIVKNPQASSIIILNTCIVKDQTHSKMLHRILGLTKIYPKKRLIVAGCLAQLKLPIPADVTLIGPHNITDIVKVVKQNISSIQSQYTTKINLPRISQNSVIHKVQILEGCTGSCTYCIVKFVKPLLFSYPQKAILQEVRTGLANGAKEIWLTSQDNGAYMLDKASKSKLPELLSAIDKIKGKFWVRVGMMNPDNILPVIDKLIDAYKSEKVFKFIHIPVQSGNNEILRLMNRRYSAKDFRYIVSSFRKAFPEITIATDIICGFPTETKAQFQDTLDLVEELKPDALNISRFMPRPLTKAKQMEQLDPMLKKQRTGQLTKLYHKIALENNQKWIDWQGEVLVDEKHESNLIARNYAYRQIILSKARSGSFKKVRITKADTFCLKGEII
ncbi:MAG: tRNA (N(6)-L-threonylcarbamoyladenosine(37)-C(2))-methylthiotransferase [Candidatus Woesearchaeota archaeon]